jgi:phosphoribosyl 1,2-cyclic phosphate phosphodiesterase
VRGVHIDRSARSQAAALGAVALARPEPSAATSERIVVIDTGPDFPRAGAARRLTHVDAVFYTHAHADHILGMDDLRPLSFIAAEGRTDSALRRSRRRTAVLEQIFPTHFRRMPRIPRGRAWN